MEKERNAWIFLNRIPNLGPTQFHRLLLHARSAQEILKLPVSGLQAAEVTREQAEAWCRAFQDPDNWRAHETELARVSRGEFQIVTELEKGYPSSLGELFDRPPVLYYKGRWPVPQARVVGLVGTRHPSQYGRSVAERLATDLSIQGITTVSGLAKGIDACIHQATLAAGGWTIAVIGCGLDRVFPPENNVLQKHIGEAGTLVSEFPCNKEANSTNFPRRNRVISGLSQGVVVIEAAQRSGASITARCAAEQGRDVFAVPGSIFQPTSAGCHRLIRDGARLVESGADIIEELGYKTVTPATDVMAGVQSRAPLDSGVRRNDEIEFATLTALEKHILQLLADAPLSADEISRGTSVRFEQVANSLLSLELKGAIRPLPGQRYAKN